MTRIGHEQLLDFEFQPAGLEAAKCHNPSHESRAQALNSSNDLPGLSSRQSPNNNHVYLVTVWLSGVEVKHWLCAMLLLLFHRHADVFRAG